jgi:hypothetical protein
MMQRVLANGGRGAMQLPLLTVGDSEYVIHDWNYLPSKMSMLRYDIAIANWVRFAGWLGLIGVAFWLLCCGLQNVGQTTKAGAR